MTSFPKARPTLGARFLAAMVALFLPLALCAGGGCSSNDFGCETSPPMTICIAWPPAPGDRCSGGGTGGGEPTGADENACPGIGSEGLTCELFAYNILSEGVRQGGKCCYSASAPGGC
jgi:hypothetical protein